MRQFLNGKMAHCFNPRAREGRDIARCGWALMSRRFNPRAREGRDGEYPMMWISTDVSIHAPARGATFERRGHLPAGIRFNPRAREGRDL